MRYKSLLFASVIGVASCSGDQLENTTANSWEDVTPSTDLKWTPCFQSYNCARLIVPLDYANTHVGNTTIAYIKQSATVKPENAEDILINPGGPGASGVSQLLRLGATLSRMLGPQYNIVGFDARGVNNSGPALNCFSNNTEMERAFQTQFIRSVDGESKYSLSHQFEMATAYGKWCTAANRDSDAKYANTVAVAHDMLNYVQRSARAKGKNVKDAKLYYYGVSYGTILGATFASLFPSRIGRMAVDGVPQFSDYYYGLYEQNLFNVDDVIADFFTYCHQAGPSACGIWEKTTQKIESGMRNVLEAVRQAPVPVWNPKLGYPQLVTYEHLDFLILSAMYMPLARWPLLSRILAEMGEGNGTTAAQTLLVQSPTSTGPSFLIRCLDSMSRGGASLNTFTKWSKYVQGMGKQSKWVASAWAPMDLVCKDVAIFPPPNQQFNGTSSTTHTSFPVLFLSNTHDPVNPLRGAQKMWALFPTSSLLVQEAPGHIASMSAQSNCTLGYITQYFANGAVPPVNTKCKAESVPFVTVG